MVAYAKEPYTSPEEYLRRERDAKQKSEYWDGVLVAMAGGSFDHNTIAFNIAGELKSQLDGQGRRGFSSDQRVRVPACNRYFYPDASVVCDRPEREDVDGVQSLMNPALIVEVLSDSTERADRGDKMRCYQTLPSLKTYVLVEQNALRIEVYERQPDESWNQRRYEGAEAIVPFSSIGCQIRLGDIYPPDEE